jgi:hypothetical protein
MPPLPMPNINEQSGKVTSDLQKKQKNDQIDQLRDAVQTRWMFFFEYIILPSLICFILLLLYLFISIIVYYIPFLFYFYFIFIFWNRFLRSMEGNKEDPFWFYIQHRAQYICTLIDQQVQVSAKLLTTTNSRINITVGNGIDINNNNNNSSSNSNSNSSNSSNESNPDAIVIDGAVMPVSATPISEQLELIRVQVERMTSVMNSYIPLFWQSIVDFIQEERASASMPSYHSRKDPYSALGHHTRSHNQPVVSCLH